MTENEIGTRVIEAASAVHRATKYEAAASYGDWCRAYVHDARGACIHVDCLPATRCSFGCCFVLFESFVV